MIKKIGTIKHFAVFENYNWDLSSTDKNGQPLKFEKINILYGRNYSGKTTLSRIFRSLETGQLPENYDNPQYELIDENGMKTDQNNISDFSYPVRVFNEDFIKRNLKFLIDPNGEIAPFAILGNNNGTLAEEIKELTNEIGNSVEPKTGLNKAVDDATSSYDSANQAWSKAVSDLESKLSKKATDKKIGIKYKPDKFGDVNYNIAKIRSDVQTICQSEDQSPSAAVIANCEAILQDTVLKDTAELKVAEAKTNLSNKQKVLEAKKRLLNDEELGAKHVNEYLNDFFGHHFVTLEAHKDNDDATHIKFCIMRNGKPAYNLSEGECSLISFCYFMAKLDDVATSGQKPIIWIDDPISSLDSNHIYFIFSLIVSKIAKTGCFSQLFISTHNLDFLKYLNRLKSYHLDKNGKQAADSKAYFLIERIGNHSSIQALPQYLKSNATEYNYLFSQIYKVSQCVAVTDDNYDILYSFGNSARKFLEMYLYFKYPTDEELLPKLKRFFEPEDVPPILINRLVNEDSHGPTPENSLRAGIDPETIPVAKKILQLLQKDSEQYDAFMESIS